MVLSLSLQYVISVRRSWFYKIFGCPPSSYVSALATPLQGRGQIISLDARINIGGRQIGYEFLLGKQACVNYCY